MRKNMIKLLTLCIFLLASTAGSAQTYSQLQWGLNKSVTPYQFGASINNTWYNLGTVSSAGAWSIPLSNISGVAEIRLSETVAQNGTDQSAALAAAVSKCSSGGLIVVDGVFTYSTTLNIPNGCNMFWVGEKGKLIYTGNSAAIKIRSSKHMSFYDVNLDLTTAGASAKGIQIFGLWFGNFYSPKIMMGGASQIGFDIHSSDPSQLVFGTYLVNIYNPYLFCYTGCLYGISTVQTPGDSVYNTHVNVYDGWVKGASYGLYIKDLHTFYITGIVVDTAIDAIYFANSIDGYIRPGELGPTTGYCINWGVDNSAMTLIAPSRAGAPCVLGYQNNTIYTPQQIDQGKIQLFGSRSDQAYYTTLQSVYNYNKSFSLISRGGGGANEIMNFGDGQGYLGLNQTGYDTLLGKSNSTTGQTSGFTFIPSVSGTPTGVPSARTGYAAMLYDVTGDKLWIYNTASASWVAH